MTAFFTEWALWEKMTFILALCIVVALSLGGCRNIYTRWRLRQYTTVGIKHPTPNMVEGQATDEIPFGIKALESGVEVEGVWISRSNTPVPSGSNSFNNSPATSARASVASSIILNESFQLPESTSSQSDKSRRHSSIRPSWASNKEPQPVLERDRSTERLVGESSRSRMPYAGSSRSRHTSMPVTSRLRESMTISPQFGRSSYGNKSHRESSSSLNDGDHYNQRPSSEPSASLDSGSSSSRSYHLNTQCARLEASSANERQPLTWPGKIRGKAILMESGADLGLLQSHRMSHVAETGQLGPRARRAGNTSNGRTSPANVDLPSPALCSEVEPEPEADIILWRESQVDLHFELPHATLPTPAQVPRGLFETPMPQYLDHMSDCSSELDLGVIQDVDRARFLDGPRARRPSSGGMKERSPSPKQHRSFKAEHDSRILRNVNSSFQVLQPGSFAPPDSANIEPALATKEKKPDRSRRHSRKLHKKQGSGGSSKRTSFIEIIYGNERHPS